ncbi:autoinducer 2 ABC transporter substrate-binding protein [Patulibacter sp. S7RM1-6]
MRKAGIALACVVAALGAVGCGGTTEPVGGSGGSGGDEQVKVAFIPQLVGIPYFTAMEQGGKAAAKELGVDFTYRGAPTASAPQQVQLLDTLTRQGYDAISMSVLDPASINPAIKTARAKGVAVLTSDSDSPESERQAYVAQATDEDLGATLMDRLAAQIGESGTVGIVSGEATATNLNAWIKAIKARAAEKYPKVEILGTRFTKGGATEDAQRQAQELMTSHRDLKGIVAVASTTVPGVAQAVESAGKKGDVAVIGYGSPATVRPFVKSGVMKESILWDPEKLGYLTVWAMTKVARGESFAAENDVPGLDAPVAWDAAKKRLLLGKPLVIDADNVDDYDF